MTRNISDTINLLFLSFRIPFVTTLRIAGITMIRITQICTIVIDEFQMTCQPTIAMKSILWLRWTLTDTNIFPTRIKQKSSIVSPQGSPSQISFWFRTLSSLHIIRFVKENLTTIEINLTEMVIVTKSIDSWFMACEQTCIILTKSMSSSRSLLVTPNRSYTFIKTTDTVIPFSTSL